MCINAQIYGAAFCTFAVDPNNFKRVCVCVFVRACSFGHLQGAPADEPDGLAAGSGRQREAGAGHAQLLRAVQEDLHRRPGAEIVKGKDAGDAAAIGYSP